MMGERVSTGADTRTLWGGGAPKPLDLRILEDGGECSGALVSNVVASDTASEGQDGTVRK